MYQIADCLCLTSGTVSKFGKTGLQCVKNLFKNLFVRWVDQTAESRKSITDIANIEIRTLGKPGGEQILISYEVTDFILYIRNYFCLIFCYCREISIGKAKLFQIFDLFIGKKFIENETENIILIFVCLDFGTHFICGFPYFCRQLLFVHAWLPSFLIIFCFSASPNRSVPFANYQLVYCSHRRKS